MKKPFIRIDRKEYTKSKLITAVGQVLAKEGFKGLGVNKVAKAAGVDKVLVYRYFGGLPELIGEYSQTVDFWPTVEELIGPNPERIKELPPDEQLAEFVKSFLSALRKRPKTQDILAWELLERNELSKKLEDIRIRTILEYFEYLDEIPDDRRPGEVQPQLAPEAERPGRRATGDRDRAVLQLVRHRAYSQQPRRAQGLHRLVKGGSRLIPV